MHLDDRPVGTILSRREAIILLGAASSSVWFGCGATSDPENPVSGAACVVRPRQTDGPYFRDEMLNRADIRSDPSDGSIKPGLPLELAILVSRLTGTGCQPLSGVQVDVWHCDHLGVYSDVQDPGFDTLGQKFLRGFQVTGTDGRANFVTVYPGWYGGRTVHIHFKLRSAGPPGFEFTSQLYFDDGITDEVLAADPYSERGTRSTTNSEDGIYPSGGSQLLLALEPLAEGYRGTFHVALQGV
jgi:protocatechuate 3,4-dioxygenase beta subunit